MNLIELRAKQKFLTKRKEEYNIHLWRYIERVYRFFDKKTEYLPPTINYTYNWPWFLKLEPIQKTLWLKIKKTTQENKIKFAENIIIQKEVLRIVKKRNEEFNYRCWLIKLTTGKGKTHIIIDITNYYQTNTLILVHNIKTLNEMIKKFKNFTNIIPSQYWWGKKEIWNITIMTKKSFALDSIKIKNIFNLVLIDEAPVWFSKSFWNWLNLFFDWKKWVALYWLSWTPQKIELDQSDLERYFWKILEIKNQSKNWYNIIPDFTFYDYIVDKWIYEYENPAEMRWVISENENRLKEQIVVIKELFKDRKCLLILTDRKLEVDNFYKNRDFWFTFLITWNTSIEEDNQNIKSAELLVKSWKKVCIIWTIQKCWIWMDIPAIDTIFLASAIKFQSTVIQSVGRWLRLFEWKNNVKVWVWWDLPHYRWQKSEKIQVIKKEYWIKEENIEIVKILRKMKKNINN